MIKNLTVNQFFLVVLQQHLIASLLEENEIKPSKTKQKVQIYTKSKLAPLISNFPFRLQEMIYDFLDLNDWSELKEFLKIRNEEIKNEITPSALQELEQSEDGYEINEQFGEMFSVMTSINVFSLTYDCLDDVQKLFPKLGEDELIKNVSYDDINYLFQTILNSAIEKIKEQYLNYFDENQDEVLSLFDDAQTSNIIAAKKALTDKLFEYFENKKMEYSDSFVSNFLSGNADKLIAGYKIIKDIIKIDFLISLNTFIANIMPEILKKIK
ncbi:hypothetical protein VQY18_01890 [Mycoplasma feriruminatoris]|uniref:Uncharacterized protein n=2 Tax=Mycoplasma feriruminatoris TaxID=1179777 RepID=A0A654IPD2_9MOLU|nr:hypothetical protein MF5583_00383 [Mycoplasma feriruminatoris]